jgi:SAM-dependent methyltransferase
MTEPLPDISVCLYCGSSKSKRFCRVNDIFQNSYEIRHCDDCSAYFLSPFPSAELLEKAYGVSYYGIYETKFKDGLIENVLDRFRKRRAKKLARQLPDGARVLDIGCGNGNFLQFLSTIGNYELQGIERNKAAAARALAKKGINIKSTPLTPGDYPDNYFDAITLFHVFEHLPNPSEILLVISRILKPGGILFISFPNIASLQARMFKGNWLHLDPPRHLFFFAPVDFKKLMKERKFNCIRTTFVSLEQNPFGMVQSILNTMFRKREILFEPMKGNYDYAAEYGKFSIFLQKLFFIASFPVFVLHDIVVSALRLGATVTFLFRKDNS